MLKKWLILAIVLSCTIFAVSSGCSEKGKENTNQRTVENVKENSSTVIESTNISGEKTETKIVSTGNSADWCAVGSSWSTVNPQTGEAANMKITGIETVDGIPMCKAIYESNEKNNDYAKLEYLWSQDGNTTLWTAYDASGKKVSEFSMKNGKMRMVDKDGKVTEVTTTQG